MAGGRPYANRLGYRQAHRDNHVRTQKAGSQPAIYTPRTEASRETSPVNALILEFHPLSVTKSASLQPFVTTAPGDTQAFWKGSVLQSGRGGRFLCPTTSPASEVTEKES